MCTNVSTSVYQAFLKVVVDMTVSCNIESTFEVIILSEVVSVSRFLS